MGAYLSEPVVDKHSSDEKSDLMSFGASSMQGWRVSQEDAHNNIIKFDNNTSMFAVYDGHGGPEVAEYCSLHLPTFIKSTDAYKDGNLTKALEDTYLDFDAKLITEDVLRELKRLAKMTSSQKGDQEENENEIDNLCNEASMPLEEVLAKVYQGAGSLMAPALSRLNADNNKPKSPFIRAKIGWKATSEAGECSSSSSSSVPFPTLSEENSEESSEAPKETNKLLNGGAGDKEPSPLVNCSSSNDKDTPPTPKTDNCSGDSKIEPSDTDSNGIKKTEEKVEKKGKGKSLLSPSKRSHRMWNAARASALDGSGESGDSDSSDEDVEFTIPHSSDDDEGMEDEEEGDEDDDDDEEDDDDEDDEDEYEEEPDEEDDYITGQEEPGKDSGCTAVVALIRGCELYVANAGDSRCVVSRKGKAIEMSIDHKPEDTVESTRIKNAGGNVTSDGRVNGGLNLSRAIGDHFYKTNEKMGAREQMITALPDVRTLTLNQDDEFMVIACDGIWNSMTSQEVVDFVKERISKSDKLSTICEALFDSCLAPNTCGDGTGCDNMTVVIVKFNPKLFIESQKAGKKRPQEDQVSEETSNCPKKLRIDGEGQTEATVDVSNVNSEVTSQ